MSNTAKRLDTFKVKIKVVLVTFYSKNSVYPCWGKVWINPTVGFQWTYVVLF